jgi:hypothetical protein
MNDVGWNGEQYTDDVIYSAVQCLMAWDLFLVKDYNYIVIKKAAVASWGSQQQPFRITRSYTRVVDNKHPSC